MTAPLKEISVVSSLPHYFHRFDRYMTKCDFCHALFQSFLRHLFLYHKEEMVSRLCDSLLPCLWWSHAQVCRLSNPGYVSLNHVMYFIVFLACLSSLPFSWPSALFCKFRPYYFGQTRIFWSKTGSHPPISTMRDIKKTARSQGAIPLSASEDSTLSSHC